MRPHRIVTALCLASVLPFALTPEAVPARPAAATTGVTIAGLDAHDGTVVKDSGVYYLYGTKYGCGFTWQQTNTPWCGFGVWTAQSLGGPWTFVRLLFDPASNSGTWKRESWQKICGSAGDGCFNPRMVRRPDGVWVLWFNAPRDYRVWGANEYWAMGCAGPTGPCGFGAGPSGSTIKPSLRLCSTAGDFSIFAEGANAWIVCGQQPNFGVTIEHLQPWWADGDGTGAWRVAGIDWSEGTGMYRAPDGQYVLTFGDNCPYCSGTDTSYAVSPSPTGPWSVPAGTRARRRISGNSCGGQPRTVAVLDGQAYEVIDLWYGQMNETAAGLRLEPLTPTGAPYLGTPNGTVWRGAYRPFDCAEQ